MADTQYVPLGQEDAPAGWLLPAGLEIVPKIAYASFDGTAATAFLPCLRIVSDSGHVAAECVSSTEVAAGGSADVTWFRGVGGGTTAAVGSSGVLTAQQDIGTAQTLTANTTTTLSWDNIAVDTSGTFSAGSGVQTAWTINVTGTYLVALTILNSNSWPTAAQGPVGQAFFDVADTVIYSGWSNYFPGTTDFGYFAAIVSTYNGVPATFKAEIQNLSSVDVVTVGGGPINTATALMMCRLGDQVLPF